jgi:hypothetical protein
MAGSNGELSSLLRYSVADREGRTVVSLTGSIDETANFDVLRTLPSPLTFDLGGIRRINSMGVRQWIDLVQELEANGVTVVFERCSPVLVTQMGMISNFMGRSSHVRSILVPYLCPSCESDTAQLFEVRPGVLNALLKPMACPKCQATMLLDEGPETYAFLK